MTFVRRHHLTGFTGRIHITVIFFVMAGLAALTTVHVLYAESNVWHGLAESRELHYPVYTEQVHEHSVFRTPSNTWSNYAFVIVGIYALGLGWADRQTPRVRSAGLLVQHPLFSALFGLACIYLGIASGIFHASLTRWGQQLDVAAMYAPPTVLIAMNLTRLLNPSPRWMTLATWGAAIAALGAWILLYLFKWQMSATHILTALALLIIALAAIDLYRSRSSFLTLWLILAVVIFLVALLFRQLDVAGRFTGPEAWMQGHAIWHILCAVGLACLYMYHRSQRMTGY